MSTVRVRRPDGLFERGQQVTRLESFVDAAFAFAVTLLAISIDSVPGNREELILALKGVPAFAASFAVISLLWWDHNVWSRQYGLDDGRSVLLSLLFVFLVLIYVYPLKLLFSAGFAWMTGFWLPSTYAMDSVDDLVLMYVFYAIAFASLGLVLWALRLNAWRQRDAIGLDALERLVTRRELWRSLCLPATALISLLCALTLEQGLPGWRYALPGITYWLMLLQFPISLLYAAEERALRKQLGTA